MGRLVHPPEQILGEAGFLYTVDFEVGEFQVRDFRGRLLRVQGSFNKGWYYTHILIHNPHHEEQHIFIKMLMSFPTEESTWHARYRHGPITEGIRIPPNGLYHLFSRDIYQAF